jgi:hypothetical protein
MNLPSLPQDKANHAIYGALLALVVAFALRTANIDLHGFQPRDVGLASAAVAACAKEGVDALQNYRATGNWKSGPHGVELFDAGATMAGGAAIWLAAV